MIRNAAVAMLEIRPERFDAALAPFVSADAIGAVGDEMRRGLSVNLPSGAHALTESIGDVAVEKIDTRGEGLSLLATWKALVSGGHWGHMHRREIQFRALIDVAEADGRGAVETLSCGHAGQCAGRRGGRGCAARCPRGQSLDVYAYSAHTWWVAMKSERFAVRLTPEQDALIRRAAQVELLARMRETDEHA